MAINCTSTSNRINSLYVLRAIHIGFLISPKTEGLVEPKLSEDKACIHILGRPLYGTSDNIEHEPL